MKQAPTTKPTNLSATSPNIKTAPNPTDEIATALQSDFTADLVDSSAETLKQKIQLIDKENELLVKEINEVQLSLKPASNVHNLQS